MLLEVFTISQKMYLVMDVAECHVEEYTAGEDIHERLEEKVEAQSTGDVIDGCIDYFMN